MSKVQIEDNKPIVYDKNSMFDMEKRTGGNVEKLTK